MKIAQRSASMKSVTSILYDKVMYSDDGNDEMATTLIALF